VLVQTRAHGAPLHGRLAGDRVRLDAPAPRVAPGQVVALYDGDRVVGGGIAA
jgi:tRNA-specific 2-thiouridylase